MGHRLHALAEPAVVTARTIGQSATAPSATEGLSNEAREEGRASGDLDARWLAEPRMDGSRRSTGEQIEIHHLCAGTLVLLSAARALRARHRPASGSSCRQRLRRFLEGTAGRLKIQRRPTYPRTATPRSATPRTRKTDATPSPDAPEDPSWQEPRSSCLTTEGRHPTKCDFRHG